MASHKSAEKRIRSTERKREQNKMISSQIKTKVKNILNTTNKERAEKDYKEVVALLDRSAVKGRIHRNTASRKKASLTKHLNNLKPTETK
jgi:small subunit ribosomal protein S20